MTPVAATLYDGRSSAAHAASAELRRDEAGLTRLIVSHAGGTDWFPLAECVFDMSVGSRLRRVDLPNGASLQIEDVAAWDATLAEFGVSRIERLVAVLERRWLAVAAAIGLSVVAVWLTAQYGIPALVDHSIALVSPELDARIGAGGLELLDEKMFAATKLDAGRKAKLLEAFSGVASDLGMQGRARLEFRGGRSLGANAFALPDGIVICTDELVALAAHDDELRAVFAHELGHVRHRHAMRALLSNSLGALLTLSLLGDVSSATGLVASVPTVLAQASYSRAYEREADQTARVWLDSAHVPQSRMDDLLRRLEKQPGHEGWTYLSSHPSLEDRLRHPDTTPR